METESLLQIHYVVKPDRDCRGRCSLGLYKALRERLGERGLLGLCTQLFCLHFYDVGKQPLFDEKNNFKN